MLAASLFGVLAVLPRGARTTEAFSVRVLVWHSSVLLVALVCRVLLDVAVTALGVEVLAAGHLFARLDPWIRSGSLVAALLWRYGGHFGHCMLLVSVSRPHVLAMRCGGGRS